jgi:hypothetical protein
VSYAAEERRGEGRTEKEGRGREAERQEELGKVREERAGGDERKEKEAKGREGKSGSPPDLWPCTPGKNPAGALVPMYRVRYGRVNFNP